jgi:hypothetical protein
MEQKASSDDILRTATRAAIRAENWDALPQIAERYLQNGGDPRYFRRWLKTNYQAATSTRGERQLEAALKDPDKMQQVVRLLDAGVSIDADESTEGYDTSLRIETPYDQVNHSVVDYGTDSVVDTSQMP